MGMTHAPSPPLSVRLNTLSSTRGQRRFPARHVKHDRKYAVYQVPPRPLPLTSPLCSAMLTPAQVVGAVCISEVQGRCEEGVRGAGRVQERSTGLIVEGSLAGGLRAFLR